MFNTIKTEQIGTLKKPTKAGHCDIEGKGLEEGIALREAHFTLTTKDTEGRQCYNEHDHVTVEIRDEQGREYCIPLLENTPSVVANFTTGRNQ